jgi:Nucleotidyltransferase domain
LNCARTIVRAFVFQEEKADVDQQSWAFAPVPGAGADVDAQLSAILRSEAVDTGMDSPVRGVLALLTPLVARWAGTSLLDIFPSGSFAKGTANRSSTDIDLFISLHWNTEATLREIYDGLDGVLRGAGFAVRRQNVSLHVKVNGFGVDLVPGKKQSLASGDHSLYLRRRDTWIKTNVKKHVEWAEATGRRPEMRLMKLWRDGRGLDWPSFYVELATARALEEQILPGTLSGNLRRVLEFVCDRLEWARLADPANGSNVVSETLAGEEKRVLARAAAEWLKGQGIGIRGTDSKGNGSYGGVRWSGL